MGLFNIWGDNSHQEYDYKRLRKDLENEYLAQGLGFSEEFGILQMLEASDASDEELVKMAKREGMDLGKYRK